MTSWTRASLDRLLASPEPLPAHELFSAVVNDIPSYVALRRVEADRNGALERGRWRVFQVSTSRFALSLDGGPITFEGRVRLREVNCPCGRAARAVNLGATVFRCPCGATVDRNGRRVA